MGLSNWLAVSQVLEEKILIMFLLLLLSLVSNSLGLSIETPACARCIQPELPPGSGRQLYLPHCVDGVTHNYCDAICTGKQVSKENQGSCEGCEAKCGMVFTPVCTLDGKLAFPNPCLASCAGVQVGPCEGLNSVIPGKTKLPPNHQLPKHLQSFVPLQDNIEKDADF